MFVFIVLQNKIHFIALNMFFTGGIVLNARTILHLKNWPESPILKLDKLLAVLCIVFYWIDLLELLHTSMYFMDNDNSLKIKTKRNKTSPLEILEGKKIPKCRNKRVALSTLSPEEAKVLGYKRVLDVKEAEKMILWS